MTPSKPQASPGSNNLLQQIEQARDVQLELDRRIFNLKTLYDVSKDILSSVDSEAILRNFLLMVMGNFGVAEGVVMVFKGASQETAQTTAVGIQERDLARLKEQLPKLAGAIGDTAARGIPVPETAPLDVLFPFNVEGLSRGVLGLGPKLVAERYDADDRELINTLLNNLSIALQNALAVEDIKSLNRDLGAKNTELIAAMRELRGALRKVEILEGIKSNLCKFVPAAVTRLMESSASGEIQEAEDRDISVLFLDIEGYTRITEERGAAEASTLIKRYFSVFMEAIYQNNGDVVETAGDGLMVLFMTDDPHKHALEAVQTAATIREKTFCVNSACSSAQDPVIINMGISSGRAFVGASKFESYAGVRWAYTAHGTTTNVAARLCDRAEGGAVLVSCDTAMRTRHAYTYDHIGPVRLKNLSEKIEVYSLVK